MKRILEIATIILLLISTGCNKQEFPVKDAIEQITTEYGYSKFGDVDSELQEWQKSEYPEKRRRNRECFRKEIGTNSFAYEVILLEYDNIDDLGYLLSYFVNFGGCGYGGGGHVYKLPKDSPTEFAVLTSFEGTKSDATTNMKPFENERLYEKITFSDALWLQRISKRTYRTYKLTLEFGKTPVLEFLDYYKNK